MTPSLPNKKIYLNMLIILVYAEFGATATDSTKINLTFGAAGISTEKSFNILVRQISCTATWR